MKSHCINGHPYDDFNLVWRASGKYECRTCHSRRESYRRALKRNEHPDNPRLFIRDRMLDLLQIDGGWLTVAGIAVRLGVSEQSVDRAIRRLKPGVLESRIVELAFAMWSGELRDWRREFRFKSPHFQADSYGGLDDAD